jgi:hypothetical protein
MRIGASRGVRLIGAHGAARPDIAACREGIPWHDAHSLGTGIGGWCRAWRTVSQRCSPVTKNPMASNVPYGLTLPGPDWPLSRRPFLIVAEVYS